MPLETARSVYLLIVVNTSTILFLGMAPSAPQRAVIIHAGRILMIMLHRIRFHHDEFPVISKSVW